MYDWIVNTEEGAVAPATQLPIYMIPPPLYDFMKALVKCLKYHHEEIKAISKQIGRVQGQLDDLDIDADLTGQLKTMLNQQKDQTRNAETFAAKELQRSAGLISAVSAIAGQMVTGLAAEEEGKDPASTQVSEQIAEEEAERRKKPEEEKLKEEGHAVPDDVDTATEGLDRKEMANVETTAPEETKGETIQPDQRGVSMADPGNLGRWIINGWREMLGKKITEPDELIDFLVSTIGEAGEQLHLLEDPEYPDKKLYQVVGGSGLYHAFKALFAGYLDFSVSFGEAGIVIQGKDEKRIYHDIQDIHT